MLLLFFDVFQVIWDILGSSQGLASATLVVRIREHY